MTKAIYPLDEPEWSGIDQNTEVINQNLYQELKSFLEEYFCGPSSYEEEESKEQYHTQEWNSSIENGLTRSNYYQP